MPPGTNPFDDDDEDIPEHFPNSSTNPFDSDRNISTNPFEEPNNDNNLNVSTLDMSFTRYDNSNAPVEASWQYLGDLPYRRVPVYTNVRWNRHQTDADVDDNALDEDDDFNNGLAAFPPAYLTSQQRSGLLDEREVRELLSSTTLTKVAGCPHGGPIAAITQPLTTAQAMAAGGAMSTTELRIMTNAGQPLANIEFPPRGLTMGNSSRVYSAADVLTIGFTTRTNLIVVLRDSLCFTYDLRGALVLPPFHILPGSSDGKGTELLQAYVYEGGVAVLSTSMQCALVELLDEHDDPSYADNGHLASRKIIPSSSTSHAGTSKSSDSMFGSLQTESLPTHYALVTPLSTSSYASERVYSYLALAVLPRFHTASRHPELFLSTSDNSVVVVNSVTGDITDVDCRAHIVSPIVAMTFAPNGRFLACFTKSNLLTVVSTSFETKVLDFDTSEGSSSAPLDMKWCGEDSVVLHWKNLGVLMVGPYGDWLRFPFDDTEHLYILPEIDCCRVVTDSAVEILQRLPPETAALMRIGSIEPSAMLMDAADAFEMGSPASDEAARAITKTGMLLEAIETCTDAATKEFDILTQKRLLRAASYGMHFAFKDPNETHNIMGGPVDGSNPDDRVMPSSTAIKFVEASKKLRVLNSLRHPKVGFVLTSSQFDTITPTGVIARLVEMKRPALATSLSKYLSLPKSVQLFSRAAKAAALVSSEKNRPDEDTAKAATEIIKSEGGETDGDGGISTSFSRGAYASVALAANQAGRPGVANRLLRHESSVADKVPALISIGSFADAVAVATAARDGDLIFHALMEYEKACLSSSPEQGQAQFIETVVTKFTPEPFNTLRRYLTSLPGEQAVKDLLLRANKFAAAGSAVAQKALATDMEPERKNRLLDDASHVFGLGKETAFHKSCTDDFIELLRDQKTLQTKYGSEDVAPESSSVTATIVSVIRYAAVSQRDSDRLLNDVEKLAKKFRVPEKRLWHIKIKALAESGQWAILRALADSRTKPPIGFRPFAVAAINGGQEPKEIQRYIERVTGLEEKYDLLLRASLWNRALDVATKLGDTQRIIHVRSVCDSPELQQRCDAVLSSLRGH